MLLLYFLVFLFFAGLVGWVVVLVSAYRAECDVLVVPLVIGLVVLIMLGFAVGIRLDDIDHGKYVAPAARK